jgi:cell migration-inducing and hyaluronan-binding protein
MRQLTGSSLSSSLFFLALCAGACGAPNPVPDGGDAPISFVSLAELADAAGGGDVTIEAGQDVVIDGDAELDLLVVRGALRCLEGVSAVVRVEGVLVEGSAARFECGSESARFTGRLEVLIGGDRAIDEALGGHGGHGGHLLGSRAFVVRDGATLALFGDETRARFVRLDADVAPGATELVLSEPVAYEAGDELALSTTSYRFEESETFVVTAVRGRQVTLDHPVAHAHIGRTLTYDDPDGDRYVVDERAYVAGLTRNIVIAAEDDALWAGGLGAHVTITEGGVAHVDAVELTRVGQRGRLGRYPFHWHLSGDVTGQFLRNASIHGSVNRCVTLHGTQHASVVGNTCFDHAGHGFFLEDGNETGNELAYNLGMLSRRVPRADALLWSDASCDGPAAPPAAECNPAPGDRFPGPATFWIAHPDNDVHHNVAVGSEGTGFWMAFRSDLFCDGTGCRPATAEEANVHPRTSDTLRFSDNVAMGAATGMTWDGAPTGADAGNPLNPGGDFALEATHYAPPTTPEFPGLVALKNSAAGIYFRGEQVIFSGAVLADNATAAFFAYNQVLRDSIVVGDSVLLGPEDLAFHLDPSVAVQRRHLGPSEGIRVYDGPFVLDDVFFADFSTAHVVNAGFDQTAIPIRLTGAAERWVNRVEHVTFAPEPLLRFDLDLAPHFWEDSYSAGVLDVTGELTGEAGTLVRPLHPMNEAPGCVRGPTRSASLYCRYALSHLRFDAPGRSVNQGFTVTRTHPTEAGTPSVVPSMTWTSPEAPGAYLNKIGMIQDAGYVYQVEGLDFAASTWMRVRFTSDAVNDLSPLIVIGSARDLPCALTELVVDACSDASCASRVPLSPAPDRAAVETARGTSFGFDGGALLLRVQATSARPQISPGAPVGDAFLELHCR